MNGDLSGGPASLTTSVSWGFLVNYHDIDHFKIDYRTSCRKRVTEKKSSNVTTHTKWHFSVKSIFPAMTPAVFSMNGSLSWSKNTAPSLGSGLNHRCWHIHQPGDIFPKGKWNTTKTWVTSQPNPQSIISEQTTRCSNIHTGEFPQQAMWRHDAKHKKKRAFEAMPFGILIYVSHLFAVDGKNC